MLVPDAIRPNSGNRFGGHAGTRGETGEEAEGQDAKVGCVPCMPTQEEVDVHNATHVPFRSWCPFCVAGKAKANPHFRKDSERVKNENIVSLNMTFLSCFENGVKHHKHCLERPKTR